MSKPVLTQKRGVDLYTYYSCNYLLILVVVLFYKVFPVAKKRAPTHHHLRNRSDGEIRTVCLFSARYPP